MTHYIPTEYPALVKRVRKLANEINAECCTVQLGHIILDSIRVVGGLWKGDTKLAKTVYILDKCAGLVKNGFNVIDVFGPINVSYETWVKRLIELGLVRVRSESLSRTKTFMLTPRGLQLTQRVHKVTANDNLEYLIREILFPQQTSTLVDLAYTEALHPGSSDRFQWFSNDRFVESQTIILRTLLYNILRYIRRNPIRNNPIIEPLEISETLATKDLKNQLFQKPAEGLSDLKDYNSNLSVYLQACNIYNTFPSITSSRGRASSFKNMVTACTRIGYFQAQLHKPDISHNESARLQKKISGIRRVVEHDIRSLSRRGLLKTKKIKNKTFYLISARKYLDPETGESVILATKGQIDELRKEMIATLKEPESWDPYRLDVAEELKISG